MKAVVIIVTAAVTVAQDATVAVTTAANAVNTKTLIKHQGFLIT